MIKKIKYLLCLIIFCSFNANATNKDIKAFSDEVATNFEKISKIVDVNVQKKEVKKYMSEIADLNWMGDFVLGKNKKDLTEKQKNDFVNIFIDYLINNYFKLFLAINKNNYKFLSSENRGNVYFVHSEILYEKTKAKVDFRIVEKDKKFFITDIITEGVSFISAQRSDVNSRISAIGFDNFLKELKNKTVNNKIENNNTKTKKNAK